MVLTRSRAWTCALVNQLGFPGLGTLMAGRRIGFVQATFMVVGFILVMAFMGVWFLDLFRLATEPGWTDAQFNAQWRSWFWAGLTGALLCGAAWVWALVSSIAILRQAQHTPPVLPAR
jgi:hypothetical protein